MSSTCLQPDYEQALRSHIGALRRKSLDEVQGRERACRETKLLRAEAERLGSEAQLQQAGLEAERREQQERRAQHEAAKAEVAAQKREGASRRIQIAALTDELVQLQSEAESAVRQAVSSARPGALARERAREAMLLAERNAREDLLRRLRAEAAQLSQELASLMDQSRLSPGRAFMVQLLAMLERLANDREVERRARDAERQAEELAALCQRQGQEHEAQMEQLEVDAKLAREAAVEQRKQAEEEAVAEEQELRERIKRNRRRAEKVEREAAEHQKAVHREEVQSIRRAAELSAQRWEEAKASPGCAQGDGHFPSTAVSRVLAQARSLSALREAPGVNPADLRPMKLRAEFPVIGSLQALESQIAAMTRMPALVRQPVPGLAH